MGEFFNDVYEIVKQIPYGKVATYGLIAKLMGRPSCSKYVGFALHSNKNPKEIKCFKVVNKNGHLAKGFAFGGIERQKELLEIENISVSCDFKVDLEKYLWNPCFENKK